MILPNKGNILLKSHFDLINKNGVYFEVDFIILVLVQLFRDLFLGLQAVGQHLCLYAVEVLEEGLGAEFLNSCE